MSMLDLAIRYPGFALDVSLRWDTRTLVLFGASGCGKSTVLEAIAGLRPGALGRVEIDGRIVHDSASPLDPAARRVGWVPQDAALFPHLTVRKNIEFGRRRRSRPVEIESRAVEVLELGPLLDRPVDALSGGERQRVALARALASGARVLLLDEPLAALDIPRRGRILEYLRTLVDTLEMPMVYVSHDPAEVRRIGGHVAVLDAGRVVAEGAADVVFGEARVLSVLELLGVENRFHVQITHRRGALVVGRTRGGSELVMMAPSGPTEFEVAVRAEDLLLSRARLFGTSARNQLEGVVESIQSDGPRAWVRVRVRQQEGAEESRGDLWVVRVTAEAIVDLELKTGESVWLVLKTSAIHVDPGPTDSYLKGGRHVAD